MNYFVDFINLHSYFQGDTTLENLENSIKESIAKAQTHNSTLHAVFLDVHEGRIYRGLHIPKFADLDNLCCKYNLKYNIILDTQHQYLQPDELNTLPQIIWLDWFVIWNYSYNFNFSSQVTSNYWYYKTKKGLFTPGKIDRTHRIKLLAQIYKRNLLDKLTWSFNPSTTQIENARKILSLNDAEWNQFIKDCTRTLDIVMKNTNEDWNHIGYPFDVSIYQQTAYSIIAESDFHAILAQNEPGQWITKFTEKTYRAIVNHHPIIFSYYPGIVKKFEENGFKSFKEYLKIPEYNDIENERKRIEATVTNIEYFSNSIELYKNQIHNDIKHNYQLFIDRYNLEIKKLSHLFELTNDNQRIRLTPDDFVWRNWPSSGSFESKKVTP